MCAARPRLPGRTSTATGGTPPALLSAWTESAPSLIIDAGTGIGLVSDLFGANPGLFDGEPYEGGIVLGHMHWDHHPGLALLCGRQQPRFRVDLYAPAQGDTEAVLAVHVAAAFPDRARRLGRFVDFHALEPGESQIGGFSVLALEIPIRAGGPSVTACPMDGPPSPTCPIIARPTSAPDQRASASTIDAALALAAGCDVLFHDAEYTDEELPARASFGHASTGYAVGLAEAAQVRQLMLYHHDPARTDDEIDAIVKSYENAAIVVTAAVSGTVLDLP